MPKLANNELAPGYTHIRTIDYTDLTAAATTQTIEAIEIPQYGQVRDVTFYLEEAFDGGATSTMTMQIGDGTDPNGYMVAKVVHVDGTEVFSGIIDGAYFNDATTDNVVNSKYYATADTLDVLFTATGANVNVLTQGKVHILAKITDPAAYAG